MSEALDRRAIALFADALDYPGPRTLEAVAECEEAVVAWSPESAALLAEFRTYAKESPLGRLQEIYTGAFDLDTLSDLAATCYPYVGHHLFGESHKRSAFLVGLRERYRAYGFEVENELPDHLVVLLRFLAVCDDGELIAEVIHEALVPALERMVGDSGERPEPLTGRERYLQLLDALRRFLATHPGSMEERLETVRRSA